MIIQIIKSYTIYPLFLIYFYNLYSLYTWSDPAGKRKEGGGILYPSLTPVFCFANRAYSDYIFSKVHEARFEETTPTYSAEEFHEVSQTSVNYYRECFKTYTMRRCLYNNTLERALQVSLGFICVVFLKYKAIQKNRNN